MMVYSQKLINLVGLLPEFDPELTESQNMYDNGYRKIYDCGNQVWHIL